MAPSNVPAEIKAVIFDTENNSLTLETRPSPTPTAEELLIKVQAVAITNGELTWKAFTGWGKEQIPTYDVVGTIVSGPSESQFKVGDEVYGRTDAVRQGTAREYATILESEAAPKPKSLSLEEAASVPMSVLTAWQALFAQAGLKEPDVGGVQQASKGKRVLITAASGGVGLFAIQLAKLAGATVVGSCGPSNRNSVLDLGADDVIDYRATTLTEWVGGDESKKFDIVFDCAGGKTLEQAWFVVKKGGVLVNIAPVFSEPESGVPEGVKGWFFIMESNGKQLQHIGQFFDAGKLKATVDSVHPLEDFQKAFDIAATGHAKGKVVLKL